MITDDDRDAVKHLELEGVQINISQKIKAGQGTGGFGDVYAARYNGIACAAKCIHSGKASGKLLRKNLLNEGLLHSKLDHPNVVKMLGLVWSEAQQLNLRLVLERTEYNLDAFLWEFQGIPMYVKLSILQDVSRGLYYLHSQNPPLLHCDLNCSNITLTDALIAKICNFGVTKVLSSQSKTVVVADSLGMEFFMPPEALTQLAHCGLSLDVFSFGCVTCQVISQQLPQPTIDASSPIMKGLSLSAKRRHHYIDQINDVALKQVVISCLEDNPQKRPVMSDICSKLTDIITGMLTKYIVFGIILFIRHNTGHYSNDEDIKMTYSLAMKEGVAQSRDLQVLLVGAENTGKTCLISSFLGEEFVEGQVATESVEMDVCKIYCKDWTRISHSCKTDLLHHQFVDQCRSSVVKTMMQFPTIEHTKVDVKFSSQESSGENTVIAPSSNNVNKDANFEDSVSESASSTKLQIVSFDGSQYDPDSLNLALWDFPGQVIFHNTHSVFLSESGIIVITFNASIKLTDEIIPRDGSSLPSECYTNISSIHYWLQVVDSTCSVEGTEGVLSPLQPTVMLAGTHIDKLHPDIKSARKIAKEVVIPKLVEELSDKPYTQHLAGINEGIEAALEQYCFFLSNKCRDEEIEHLKNSAIKAATSHTKMQPIFFLKIERALLNHKDQAISKSEMANIIASSAFPIAEDSSEFESLLKYFHDKRVILNFNQIKSLKNLVILSPRWLAKLFSYIITAHSYKRGKGFDESWKRLNKFGILHEDLLVHMLNKFHSDHPGVMKVTKEQMVDILLRFHLVARITREAWFSEEGYPSIPDDGDTFIVPSLVPHDSEKNPPSTESERFVYFKFFSGFIPTSLLNQLIAKCICRNVEKNSRLLW